MIKLQFNLYVQAVVSSSPRRHHASKISSLFPLLLSQIM